MLDAGQAFALIAYAELLLEACRLHAVPGDVVDSMFELLVSDFAGFALAMVVSHPCTPDQERHYRGMLRKPVLDAARRERLWAEHVLPLCGTYTMRS